jgi:hypothetical protein
VEHAALAGVHGREAEGLSSVVYCVDGVVCSVLQGAGTGGLVAVGIEGDAVVIFGFEAEDLGSDVFESAKEFAFAGEKEVGIGPFAFDVDVAAFEAVRIDCASAGSDADQSYT